MPDEKHFLTSRRQLAGMAAAGVAAAAAPAAAAAATVSAGDARTGAGAHVQPLTVDNLVRRVLPAVALANPFKLYPGPPFMPQQQAWPGLAKNMSPKPDHGETSYIGTGRLLGRRALITGGDSGIGRAAAIAFAREGADVAISYLPAEEPDAREVVQLIQNAGRKAVALPGDIRDAAFCRQMVDNAVSGLGGLDILVSNAARQHTTPSIVDISDEYFDWTIKTNIYAMFWIVKAAIPHLPPGAAVICTTSVNAYNPEPDLLDYSMTKGAIAIFVKALAKQMIAKGIRVNGVAPGPFWSPLQVSGGDSQTKLVAFGGETPIGRPGQPAELAPIYVTLASPEASYVTGQIYGATGGSGNP
jgi:NAD(P)-dependent dehydrogenase (short-subunit alcohol dehydrogenase family)